MDYPVKLFWFHYIVHIRKTKSVISRQSGSVAMALRCWAQGHGFNSRLLRPLSDRGEKQKRPCVEIWLTLKIPWWYFRTLRCGPPHSPGEASARKAPKIWNLILRTVQHFYMGCECESTDVQLNARDTVLPPHLVKGLLWSCHLRHLALRSP